MRDRTGSAMLFAPAVALVALVAWLAWEGSPGGPVAPSRRT